MDPAPLTQEPQQMMRADAIAAVRRIRNAMSQIQKIHDGRESEQTRARRGKGANQWLRDVPKGVARADSVPVGCAGTRKILRKRLILQPRQELNVS